MPRLRVLTLNLWSVGRRGNWEARRRVLVDGLRDLRPDLIAFQEAFKTDEHDTVAEIVGPEPIGPLLFVNHLPSWKPQLERERELQTVAAARAVEEAVAERPAHVV